MENRKSLIAVFAFLDDFIAALKSLKEMNLVIRTIYSPAPSHAIREVVGWKPSPVRLFTLAGGILGILAGVGLTVYTAQQWRFIVSGKPIVPIVPAVIVAFEFCILFGILFNLAGMLISARLPKMTLPEHYDVRFTRDRFGVLVACPEAEFEKVERMLKDAGAEEVHETEG